MSRLIDADELINKIPDALDEDKKVSFNRAIIDFTLMVTSAPTVEPKKGYWKPLTHDFVFGSGNHEIAFYSCSICHEIVDEVNIREDDYKFCPYCGANMREEEDE